MDLEKLQFKISNNGELSVSEKEFLLEVYMNTFAQIYGIDIYDSLLKIVGKNNQLYNKIKKFSENYNKSKELFNELSIREDLSLLLIYIGDKLIGAGRIKKIDEETASIPDIAIGLENCEEKNEIWRLAVAYVESYLQELGFSKMYVEIPLKNPWLLYRADDLGFVESPEDVVNNEVNRTYLLNKELERTKDAESNIKHK